MNSTLKKIFFFLILFSFLFPILTGAITFRPPFELPTFKELIDGIISFLSWVAIAIVPITIIIAAFYFLTSGGDPEKVRIAKRIIFYTIIGLIIILLFRGLPAIIEQIIVGPPGGGGGPPNQPPVASFTKSASTVVVGQLVSFNASTSSDSDGFIVSYNWNFGDGTTGSGVIVSHSYSVAGNYTVKLTVTDDDGASNSATSTLTVNAPVNLPPTADARVGSAPNPTGTSVIVGEGATVYFDGSTYSSDSDGTITKYEWDFKNDGIYDWSSTTTGKITFVYSAGSYTAKLRVTDDDGATATDTVNITVNPAPALTASIASPSDGQIFLQGASVTFSGSVSGGVSPYTYSWTSNIDGVIGNTLTFNKNNLSVGVHTITFKVTDSAPMPVTASDTITITITNDVTPPDIKNAKVNPTSGPSGTIFIITVDISDPLGVDPATTIAHIQNPDEKDVAQVTLFDDGLHNDGAANDGTYGASWNSTGFPVGSYYVDITACDLIGNCAEVENI